VEYRRLGHSGLRASAIALGAASFGRQCGAATSAAIVDRALDLGINLVDTADVYGDGVSEEHVGRAIAGRRQDVVLATKFGNPTGPGPLASGASRRYVTQALQASLRRLRTDYVDLYQIHSWDPTTPLEETLRALDDLVRQGLVRYVGCSNFRAWQVVESQWVARTEHLSPLISVQVPYHLLDRGVETELLPACARHGLGVLPYFPLAGGFLSGRYRPGQAVPAGTRLASARLWGKALAGQVVTETNYARLAVLEHFARERGRTLRELALAWLVAQPAVSSVLAGATRPEQVEENVRAFDWRLAAADLAQLDTALGDITPPGPPGDE
jgi:aryl-alcohol dehydrogenase-like predicted oxidoreductase